MIIPAARAQATASAGHDHQEVAMNPIGRSGLIRRVAGVLTGLAAALAPITTGPAAVASQLRPDPPGWLTKRASGPARLPPLPPGWNKHPPLPGPAHAPPVGMPGWQITLIAAATVLPAAAAVLAGRVRAARRRAARTRHTPTAPPVHLTRKETHPMSDDLAVTDLVARARDGDQRAWDALVKRHAPLIWSICRRYRLGCADAQDVAQTVWLRLVDQLDNIRDPPRSPTG